MTAPGTRRLFIGWPLFCYGVALVPCFGTGLLLVFPFRRLQRIWRNRGYPATDQAALWDQLRFHRWLAFAISLVVWAMTFIVPLLVGVGIQLAEGR